MAWIDNDFPENPKVEKIHDRAFRFHVTALCYCHRNATDGHVSAKAVKIIGAILETTGKRWPAELAASGLWKEDELGDGFWINDYLLYNPSRDEAKQLRDARRAAGRKGAAARWNKGKSDDTSNSNRHGISHMAEQKRVVEKKPLKAVPADQEIEHEVDKIMRAVKRADPDSRDVILSYARKLPFAAVAKVRESCELKRVGAGYAVNALKSELADLEEVA
jgi:hypothetical protein